MDNIAHAITLQKRYETKLENAKSSEDFRKVTYNAVKYLQTHFGRFQHEYVNTERVAQQLSTHYGFTLESGE